MWDSWESFIFSTSYGVSTATSGISYAYSNSRKVESKEETQIIHRLIFHYPPTPAAQGEARKGKGVSDTADVRNPPTPADARGSASGQRGCEQQFLLAATAAAAAAGGD